MQACLDGSRVLSKYYRRYWTKQAAVDTRQNLLDTPRKNIILVSMTRSDKITLKSKQFSFDFSLNIITNFKFQVHKIKNNYCCIYIRCIRSSLKEYHKKKRILNYALLEDCDIPSSFCCTTALERKKIFSKDYLCRF